MALTHEIDCETGAETIVEVPANVMNADVEWTYVRAERNKRLAACDWTLLPDCPLDSPTRLEWISYRQALRDITEQADPFDIAWPQEPE